MKSTLFYGLQFCRWQYGSISIRLAIVAFQMYARNSKKIRTYSSSRSSKVIDIGVNRKPMYDFLLVINSNFGRISYRFRDIDAFSSKIACIPPLTCLAPPSGRTPWDINIVYTPLQSAFSGLQFCRRHYGSIFIYLAVVASRNREISRNSDKIWPYSSSRSSKVIDLGVVSMEIPYVTS